MIDPSTTGLHIRDMPKITDMPTATTAAATASESYSYSVSVPNSHNSNPYILHSSLPNNLVFIIVGAVIGAILAGFVCYRVVAYFMSRQLAKSDKEVYFSRPSSVYQFGLDSSSSSSFFEKQSVSTASINQLSKHGLMVWLAYRDLDSSSDSSTPGRLYRQAVTGKDLAPRRNSMFVSPVLELMNKRDSQWELPLYHDGAGGLNLSFVNGSESDVSDLTHSERPLMKRPPSQYLEDLIT